MLTKVRIEVEEHTAEDAVTALTKYEHIIHLCEVERWGLQRTNGEPTTASWPDTVIERSFFNDRLGRELVEEVIEYDDGIPGYRGRRVIRFTRIDSRTVPAHRVADNAPVTVSGSILTGPLDAAA